MSRGDGKNPKFRILCKRCNSYQHTTVEVFAQWKSSPGVLITCGKCDNTAQSFEEQDA